MSSRPVISVYSQKNAQEIVDNVSLPAVFTAPIRDDIVQFVHTNMAKNRRQAHGVHYLAGKMHSAESWGTGRAVARIPRISGSGTHRSGQAAFGNMCRKGHMFAPLKTYRKWHRKINLKQKRHAVASALAASACTPLVMARGHRIENVPELPLVIDSLNIDTTKTMLATLERFGAGDDLKRVRASRKIRSGKGKMRNSRYVMRKGPLVIYGDENNMVKRTVRNLPGVDFCHVARLNLLQLAPGGHLGRFVIWTKDAMSKLNDFFGTYRRNGLLKKGYQLNRNVMSCADLARIINSDEVQKVLRAPVIADTVAWSKRKVNPLTNAAQMKRINPFDAKRKETEKKQSEDRHKARVAKQKTARKDAKKDKKARRERFNAMSAGLAESAASAQQKLDDDYKKAFGSDSEEEDDE